MNANPATLTNPLPLPTAADHDSRLKILTIGLPADSTLRSVFSASEFSTLAANTLQDAFRSIRQREANIVVLNVQELDDSTIDSCDKIRQLDSRIPVVIVAQHASTAKMIEVAQRGVYECVVRPIEEQRLKTVLVAAMELSHSSSSIPFTAAREPKDHQEILVGDSPAMQDIYKRIGHVALLDSPVLITGESGTGKELVARCIHSYSRRNRKPFCVINCGAFPEPLLESELFGVENGTFSGSGQRRIGKLEQTNGGTVFLDEIGDMSPATQAKLLRLLSSHQFERVGSVTAVAADVRIIAATNRDMSKETAARRFRQDLFYRLGNFAIQIPPLREHPQDIPELAMHFVRSSSDELRKNVTAIADDVLEVLRHHSWPGNVRELQSAIFHAVFQSTGNQLKLDHLPLKLISTKSNGSSHLTTSTPNTDGRRLPFAKLTQYVEQMLAEGKTDIYREIIHEVDRHVLVAALRHFHGLQIRVAEVLGMSRMTLRTKLRSLGMINELSLYRQVTEQWHDDHQPPTDGDTKRVTAVVMNGSAEQHVGETSEPHVDTQNGSTT